MEKCSLQKQDFGIPPSEVGDRIDLAQNTRTASSLRSLLFVLLTLDCVVAKHNKQVGTAALFLQGFIFTSQLFHYYQHQLLWSFEITSLLGRIQKFHWMARTLVRVYVFLMDRVTLPSRSLQPTFSTPRFSISCLPKDTANVQHLGKHWLILI